MFKTAEHSHFRLVNAADFEQYGDKIVQISERQVYESKNGYSVHLCEVDDGNGWISVKDRLPKMTHCYSGVDIDGNEYVYRFSDVVLLYSFNEIYDGNPEADNALRNSIAVGYLLDNDDGTPCEFEVMTNWVFEMPPTHWMPIPKPPKKG